MTLSTRLWVWGALVPAVVLALAFVSTDRLFHAALLRSLDQALLAQAAVETVSLFDGPKNEPHLHMSTSPLVESVRPFAPEGVLFGPDGEEVMRYPPPREPRAPEQRLPLGRDSAPTFVTVEDAAGRRRELVVTVPSPAGARFTLKLSASLAQLDQFVESFHRGAIVATAAAALLLVVIQLLQGRGLRRRLASLGAHLEAVRAGDLERVLEPEPEDDEVSALRALLGQAMKRLESVRAARERLLADAAHELRTPLSLMRTRLDLALRRERSPAELKQALEETREEVRRLTTLATRLLDTAATNRGPVERQPTELNELIDEALEATAAEAQARQLGLKNALEGPLHAQLDAVSVRQALDNLLSNALKVAPPGTTVTVHATRDGDRVRLSVADAGPGIPPAEREAVFEPFHRVRGGPPGTGLGLSIVREVAQRHDGRAWVDDTVSGARLVIELRG